MLKQLEVRVIYFITILFIMFYPVNLKDIIPKRHFKTNLWENFNLYNIYRKWTEQQTENINSETK